MVHRLFGHHRQVEATNSQSDLSKPASSRPTNNWPSNEVAVEDDEDDMGSRMNGLIEPNREQQRAIEARRQRNDRISQLMGGYLLRGYKMLDEYCPTCTNILMEDRQGVRNCVACEEVDNIRPPNQHSQGSAALAEISLDDSVNLYRVAGGAQLTAADEGTDSVDVGISMNSVNTERRALVDKASVACSFTAPMVSPMGVGDSSIVEAVRVVEQKLKWATNKLRTSQNVKESCELVELMRSCADMIARFAHS